jgi:hypothetical protein
MLALSLILLIGNITAGNPKVNKKVLGTWEYSSEQAPYEYSEGNIILSEKEGKIVGVVMIDGYEMELKNLSETKNKVSFNLYVEGEEVDVEMTINKKAFTGTASFSEGSIPFSGKKITNTK